MSYIKIQTTNMNAMRRLLAVLLLMLALQTVAASCDNDNTERVPPLTNTTGCTTK